MRRRCAYLDRSPTKAMPLLSTTFGVLYANGQGVPQDYAEAVKWYRKAAEQGVTEAQYNLGHIYSRGVFASPSGSFSLSVSQDIVQAYMWFSLAASQGLSVAKLGRDDTANQMTPDQIAEAQRMAREWMEKHQR